MKNDSSDRFQPFRSALEARARGRRLRALEPQTPALQAPWVEREGRRLLNFSSNDYLGLATDPDSIEAAARAAHTYGVGAGSSRLVAGTFDLHQRLESELADHTRRATALLFNSGFQANTSIIPAVTDRNDLILSDEGIHNSLIQGCRLSRAGVQRFRHNDHGHLDELIRANRPEDGGRVLIVTESLFSMDGDRAPLAEIARIAERHDALLMVDDAHAFGVLGSEGRGLAADLDRVDLLVGTFGKALGAAGAFVACNETIRDHLVNFCSGFIYSTAPAPPTVGAVRAALQAIRSGRLDLAGFRGFVRDTHERLRAAGFDTAPSDTHIIPIRLGADEDALACAAALREQGILAVAIRPPTVPEGTARLRISLGRLHTRAHVETLIEGLRAAMPDRETVRPSPTATAALSQPRAEPRPGAPSESRTGATRE